jgi:phage baseplate assembly protein W
MNIGTWTITDAEGNILSPASQGLLDLAATGLNEVLQNVRVITNTIVGTVMGDRKFGLNAKYLDAPQNQAQLMIVAELCSGLTYFEPRVTFKSIQFDVNTTTLAMDVTMAIDIDISELIPIPAPHG